MTDDELLNQTYYDHDAGRRPLSFPAPCEIIELEGRVFGVLRDGYKTRVVYELLGNPGLIWRPRRPGEYPALLDREPTA